MSELNPLSASISVEKSDTMLRFVFTGSLTTQYLKEIDQELQSNLAQASGNVEFDLKGIERLDTAGALLLNLAVQDLNKKGVESSLQFGEEQQKTLLDKSRLPEEAKEEKKSQHSRIVLWLNSLGHIICDMLSLVGQLLGFLGHFLVTLGQLILHPRKMRWTSLVFNIEQVGLRAIPIVCLLTFLIGMVVAYMGAQQLEQFGAQVFAVKLLEVTVMREMAVLITAIVVAGRSSSSFTAQIGAMVANEEVDALRSMGLDPNILLVVPRCLALIFSLPLLVFVADVMALAGGASALLVTMDLSYLEFVTQLKTVASVENFFVGMVKTPFFALAIGQVGCFHGFRASTSAESVGLLTTVSVVQSIFVVILLDALFAIFFMSLGI